MPCSSASLIKGHAHGWRLFAPSHTWRFLPRVVPHGSHAKMMTRATRENCGSISVRLLRSNHHKFSAQNQRKPRIWNTRMRDERCTEGYQSFDYEFAASVFSSTNPLGICSISRNDVVFLPLRLWPPKSKPKCAHCGIGDRGAVLESLERQMAERQKP
jgi:hypothetical protein